MRKLPEMASTHSAPATPGKVVATATKGGASGMVQEEFDSKIFYHFPSFSLEVVKSLQRLPSFPLLFIHFSLSHFSRKS